MAHGAETSPVRPFNLAEWRRILQTKTMTHLHNFPFRRLVLAFVICFPLLFVSSPVRADIAPPRQPPGGNPTNSVATQVQMIAETVVMEVSELQPAGETGLAADLAQAEVEAKFTMRNLGEAAESLQVWFPLMDISGEGDGFGNYPRLEIVQVKVNGQPVSTYGGTTPTPNTWDQNAPDTAWAVFDAVFPPQENVLIEISFTLKPTGYIPLGRFLYLLETGSGWQGPIGSVDLILRLPYAASEENVVQDNLVTTPGGEFIGQAVRWRFVDLEPERDDNWQVELVLPHYWKWLLAAREAASASPEDAQAWATLALAARTAALDGSGKGYFRRDPGGDKLLLEANAAYDRSLALDPTVVSVHNQYADFLLYWMLSDFTTPLTSQDPRLWRFAQEINISLAADPANLTMIDQRDWLATLYPQLVIIRPDGGLTIAGAPEGLAPTPLPSPTFVPTQPQPPTSIPLPATQDTQGIAPAVEATNPAAQATVETPASVPPEPVQTVQNELAEVPDRVIPPAWGDWLEQNGISEDMLLSGTLVAGLLCVLVILGFVVLLLRLARGGDKKPG